MKNIPLPPLSTLYVYLSSSCNLRCRHCWIDPPATVRPQGELRLSDLKRAVTQAVRCGLRGVKLTGGEPFLYPRILAFIAFLGKQNLDVTIETNATLIGEREALALSRAPVRSIAVSLDAPSAQMHDHLRGVDGSFDRARKGVGFLRRFLPKTHIQVVFSLWRGNAASAVDMIPFARSLGAGSLKINIIYSASKRGGRMSRRNETLDVPEVLRVREGMARSQAGLAARERFPVIFDLPPAFASLDELRGQTSRLCGIKSILGILGDGSLSMCGIGSTLPELVMGSIKDSDIRAVWKNHPILHRIRRGLPGRLEGVCGRCLMKAMCLGKCRAAAYFGSGSLYAPFPFCQEAYDQGLFPRTRLL